MVTAAMKLKDAWKKSSLEEKKAWKKSYDKFRQHIKKQRHHFADKGLSSQSYGFSIVLYRCGSWTIRKAEHRRTDALELWCQIRLLRVPWPAQISNQSIAKEINPEYSLGGLMLKLKLQSFGYLMQRANSWKRPWCWERLRQQEKGATEDEMVR